MTTVSEETILQLNAVYGIDLKKQYWNKQQREKQTYGFDFNMTLKQWLNIWIEDDRMQYKENAEHMEKDTGIKMYRKYPHTPITLENYQLMYKKEYYEYVDNLYNEWDMPVINNDGECEMVLAHLLNVTSNVTSVEEADIFKLAIAADDYVRKQLKADEVPTPITRWLGVNNVNKLEAWKTIERIYEVYDESIVNWGRGDYNAEF